MSAAVRHDTAKEPGPKRGLTLAPAGPRAGGVSFTSVPRADLLPPELGQREKARGVRRGLRGVVFLVAILVAAAVGGAWFLAFSAQTSLDAARQQTQALALQKSQFAEVQLTQQAIALGEAAVVVGGSTDIDWKAYFATLEAQLPAGVRIENLSVESATPVSAYPQSETPLEGPRIATLSFVASSDALPAIPDWLDRLSTLPGFVDATPTSVSLEGSGYSVSITMHIDAAAYSGRFDPTYAPDADGAGTGTDANLDGVADGAANDPAAGDSTEAGQ
ncbi:MAG: hypothetical protein J0G30_04620 [Actinomycetales bacterium]|nr:hypothetical protein [Actinomycetales bacterium]